jgi:hypothetical protein
MQVWKIGGALLALLAGMASQQACAALNVQLSGTNTTSLVNVVLTDQSVATASWEGNQYLINPGWSFDPTFYDPFPPAITGDWFGAYSFTSGGAVLSNLTRGWTVNVYGVWLQDSSNSPLLGLERFGVLTEESFQFAAGDVLQLSGMAVIDLGSVGLTFSDLSPGSTGEVCGLGLCGELSVLAVPEPASLLLLAGGLALLHLRRRTVVQPDA